MQWGELTKEAISKTLEKMFYTLVEFEGPGEEADWDQRKKLSSYIKLSGEDTVIIIITLAESSAFQLAADFTGVVVNKVKREEVEDCIKELANMVGGYCISSTGGKYSLGLPQVGYPKEIDGKDCGWAIPLFVLGEKWGEVKVCLL